MFDRKRLQAQMVLRGESADSISKKLGINTSTFYRKMGNDGDFTRAEIGQIIDILKIEDPMSIFFANDIA